ncbi:serine-protein kinase ATM-like [Hetaerina americana]|uniref:serine-protein kinase ATM-like n=1 Tax=Hetaerina americana TaxID=62018 RepID=UPI003A7F5D7D
MVDKASLEYLNSVRAMAEYANEQYILTSKYIDSKSFSQKEKGISDARYIASDYEGAINISLDEKTSIAMLLRQAKIDEEELKQCEADKTSYMEIAIDYYIRYLKFSPEIDIPCAFRFVSLFLEINSADELVSEEVESIPSYKLIYVIPQLLPRIVQSKGNCSRILKSIVEKCAISHPHHVIPNILALAYSLKDLDKADDSDAFMTETQKENQLAAQKMISKLKKIPSLIENVKEQSELWEALISLSYLKVNSNLREYAMDENIQLTRLKDLTHVQVSTVELAISPTGMYDNIISIHKYMPKFTLVGGINMPKRITCIGTDGKNYRQLLKSQDDLRQDAVMQQVFQLINFFLKKDENAQKRRLHIRTYKVVPLSHRSGIIEWCTNCTAIGTYLQGTKKVVGAHAKFNPSDYSVNNCKDILKNVQKEPKHIKLQVFLEICDNLQPVFRHYFFGKFPNPAVWYEKIQSYTRSVATSSMIGYVLGLGDRHLQNILIDAITAEVIHVDLGIAFEQGRTISSPETVPFRLTRDIVDGMGVSGVEGVFRKSCEVTMTLMRKHREIILAVLEVLIYDPLYAWTIKPRYKIMEVDLESSNVLITLPPDNADLVTALPEENSSLPIALDSPVLPADVSTSKISAADPKSTCDKTSNISTEASTRKAEQNATAIRALERLEQKLLGTEDGTPASSIEAQVEKLIQEAQDPKNLCLLYPGWQPYL